MLILRKWFFIKRVVNQLLFITVASASPQVEEGVKLWRQGEKDKAISVLVTPAQEGDAEACFYLSQINLFTRDPKIKTGLSFLKKSINLGFLPAMDTLAGYYLHGTFVGQDHHKALMYYHLAANRGYGPSQFNYGIMLKNAEKTPQDLENAFVYLALAALNRKDLDELVEDAAVYRDEVARQLSSLAYQRSLIKINGLLMSSLRAK